MRRLKFRFLALTGAVLAVAAISPVRAQDSDDLKRAVARISLMDGQVSVRRGDSGEWVAGIVNAPLMADDHIATGPNSRAEVQFDASHMLRMGGNAEIHLTQLEYGRFQMELAKGTLTYRVLRASGANAEVDTPTVSVRPSRVGVYRISVSEAGETEVTSRAGDLEVFTPRGSQWVNAGQTMMARGTASDPEFQIVGAIPVDDWDHWNESRDSIFLQPSPSAQYIDPGDAGMYGTQDLDNNGTWTTVPDYGPVWRPTTVAVGWSPYSNGRWVWNDWYGWTWVDYDTWGWAPFHYGRWFHDVRWGWCWYPGARGVRSYWSPGLVAWFGYGGGVGFGFGYGNVGWVALAPFEAFHPWWGRGFYGRDNFYRNVNITNVNISTTYRNARVAGGVSGMAAGDFRSGRFGAVSHLTGAQVGTAGLVRGQMPLAPTSASLHFTNRQASFTPAGSANTRFFTHQQPTAAQRVPFSQQQRPMAQTQQATPSRGAAMPQRQAAGPAAPARQQPSAVESNTRPNAAGGSSGWRRFGEPSGSSGAPQASAAPRNEANSYRGGSQAPSVQNTRPAQGSAGWQRFGNPGGSQNSAPSYSAPRSAPAPSYSAPRSAPAPSYSAPRSSGGGGGGGTSHPSSSGGGGHSSGGGGHHR
jgi:hypothetical protein